MVKTLLQVDATLPASDREYAGIVQCARSAAAKNGWLVLFSRGLVPRLFYVMPLGAVMFATYEMFKSFVVHSKRAK